MSETVITYLELGVNEHVQRLDVAMRNTNTVEVVYGFDDLTKHIFGFRLREITLLEQMMSETIPGAYYICGPPRAV